MSDIGRTEFRERVPDLTIRTLDHWTRQGWLKAEMRPRRDGGRGERFWPESEVDVARLMLRLVEAGWYAEVAASLARAAVEGWIADLSAVKIGPGLRLSIEDVPA